MASEADYRVLGIQEDASVDEIRAAYRRRARILHPDIQGTGSAAAFVELTRAYEQLISTAAPAGSQELPRHRYESPERARIAETVVVLTRSEARYGTRLRLSLERSESCPTCRGRSFVPGAICLACGGARQRSTPRGFTVDIPPGVHTGQRIMLFDSSDRPLALLRLRVPPIGR